MKSNNVYFFPSDRTTHLTVERTRELVENNKKEAAELIIDSVVPEILSKLNEYSVTITNDYDIGLLCEVIRSSIYRAQNIDHPLQTVSETLIRIVD